MSLSAAWNSPSSVILTAVIAANLLLPASHFLSGAPAGAEVSDAAPVVPAPARSTPPPARIEPLTPPALEKRVPASRPPSARVCRAWGPFSQDAEARHLADRLGFHEGSFEVLASQTSDRPDYLVTVSVPGELEATRLVLGDLERRHVDTYLMEREADRSVLSVGVFSARPRAEAQRSRMAELGYQASVKTLDRSHRVYHLLARIPAETRPEVAAAGACGDIAPDTQFL